MDVLHDRLKSCGMVRFRKTDVLKDLPDKTRMVLPCELKDYEEYQEANQNFLGWLRKNKGNKVARSAERSEALVKIGYLLRLCAKLKIRSVVDWTNRFLEETDEKLVLFAIHKKAIRVYKRRVDVKSIIVDGSVTGRKRQNAIDQFQKDPDTRLAICNLKAGGVGINLTAASTMAVTEFWWNPGVHLQAEARIDRIGQKRKVRIYYMVSGGTLEERLCKLLQSRQETLSQAFDGEESSKDFNIYDELIRTVKRELK